ncbi:MAG: DNA alkylation repair protein [Opitutaceae bacterium]
MAELAQPALRDIFNPARFRQVGALIANQYSRFDQKRFLQLVTIGLEPLSLLQRMRHGTQALRATLPADYPAALTVLRKVAPRLTGDFVGMMLPDFVGVYGADHFEESLEALHFLTRYSSAEFAIREFLRRDLARTVAIMQRWSLDPNEHVRRLASEGSRPRLPWSSRLEALVADPTPTAVILENLRADPSLYVRKSVANHLYDISKDHSDWMLARLGSWDLDHPLTQWIAKRAARSLIKAGYQRALRLFQFTGKPATRLSAFRLTPAKLILGQSLEFSFTLTSTSRKAQRLVIDYRIDYVKASGGTAPKVFKLREVSLAPGGTLKLRKRQTLQNFTTRKHYPGRHHLELLGNGHVLGRKNFLLSL